MIHRLASITLALAALTLAVAPSRAQQPGNPDNANSNASNSANPAPKQQAAVSRSAQGSQTSLQQGLGQAGAHGKPVSGKFDDQGGGKVLLSIVTATDGGYSEVVVDPDTGQVVKSQKITDAGDLGDAQAQKTTMDQATEPLAAATDDAVQANGGFVAISVYPEMQDGHPVAEVTLVRDGAIKTVRQKLD